LVVPLFFLTACGKEEGGPEKSPGSEKKGQPASKAGKKGEAGTPAGKKGVGEAARQPTGLGDSKSPEEKAAAAKALAKSGKAGKEAIPGLFKDFDEIQSAEAYADLLLKIGVDKSHAGKIGKLLETESLVVFKQALRLAMSLGGDGYPLIKKYVDDESNKLKQFEAFQALGTIRPVPMDVVPGLIENLKGTGDKSMFSLRALVTMGESVVPNLLAALEQNQEPVFRSNVVHCVRAMGKASVGPILAGLDSAEAEVRRGVVAVLSSFGADAKAHLPKLMEKFNGETDQLARLDLLEGMTKIDKGSTEVADCLCKVLLEEKDQVVRGSAAVLLGEMEAEKEKIKGTLGKAKLAEERAWIRDAIDAALAKIG
jgi:HEAT repeat protein